MPKFSQEVVPICTSPAVVKTSFCSAFSPKFDIFNVTLCFTNQVWKCYFLLLSLPNEVEHLQIFDHLGFHFLESAYSSLLIIFLQWVIYLFPHWFMDIYILQMVIFSHPTLVLLCFLPPLCMVSQWIEFLI